MLSPGAERGVALHGADLQGLEVPCESGLRAGHGTSRRVVSRGHEGHQHPAHSCSTWQATFPGLWTRQCAAQHGVVGLGARAQVQQARHHAHSQRQVSELALQQGARARRV